MKPAENRSRGARLWLAVLLVVGLLFLLGSGMPDGNPLTDALVASERAQGSPVTVAGTANDRWVISPRRAVMPNPIPRTDQTIAKGHEIYRFECQTCHGPEGQNDGPAAKIVEEIKKARKLTDPSLQEEPDGSLFWKITEGRGSMPSHEKMLTEEERWLVVHFLRTFATSDAR